MLFCEELKATLECLLFATGEPLQLEELSSILSLGMPEVEELLTELINDYQSTTRGLQIIAVAGGYQMVTRAAYASYIEKLCRPKISSLSKPAMETLAIIAYRQPVVRAEIEAIRGVKVDHLLYNLIDKNLIQEVGRKDMPGRPILYGTTSDFLAYFGLYSLDDLPSLNQASPDD